MKPLQIVACVLTLVFAAAVQAAQPAPTPEIQQLLKEGQEAYQKGDIEGAKSAFEMVYTLDSRNLTAISYLTRIRAMKGAAPKGGVPIERQVASVMIPQIQFRDATLGSAVDYLKKAVVRESGGKVAVNFVVELPAEQLATQTVTLSLNRVPFTEAVKYLASVANLDVEYQKYAIVLKPKGEATATAAATTTGAPTTAPTPTSALPGAQ